MPDPYPLLTRPILMPKVWGGDRLRRLGKAVDPGAHIGESWELADLSVQREGVDASNLIQGGWLDGQSIRQAVEHLGADLLGDAHATSIGGLPLLAKFLDAREHLSVQVHPSPEYARAHPDAHVKTECWYVVHAEPGAELFLGFSEQVDRDAIQAHVRAGTLPDVLRRVPAVAGEMHLLPSGLCHALGAGVVVAEVQTPSDTTFRLHDWHEVYDRPARTMHIESALEAMTFDPPPAARSLEQGQHRGELVSTTMFTVEEMRMNCEEQPLIASASSGPVAVMVINAMGGSIRDDVTSIETQFQTGSTMLIPAAIAGRCTIAAGPSTRLLVTHLHGA